MHITMALALMLCSTLFGPHSHIVISVEWQLAHARVLDPGGLAAIRVGGPVARNVSNSFHPSELSLSLVQPKRLAGANSTVGAYCVTLPRPWISFITHDYCKLTSRSMSTQLLVPTPRLPNDSPNHTLT